MVHEYIVPIKGDTSQLEKVLARASGEMHRLNENEVLIKLNYDGNIKGFNQVFDSVLKACPELNVQFQYNVNKELLESELKKLNDLSVDINLNNAEAKLSELSKLIVETNKKWEDASDDEAMDRYDKELSALVQKMVNYHAALKQFGDDGEKIYQSIGKDVKTIVSDISSMNSITPKIDTAKVQKQEAVIADIQNTLEGLKKLGAVDLQVTDESKVKELEDQIRIIKFDIQEIRTQMNDTSGELFKSMQEDLDGLNKRLNETIENLNRLQNPSAYNLDATISSWHSKGISEKERYTAFSSQSMQVSDSTLEGEMEKISGSMVRAAIENSKIAVDGFLHSHPTIKAAFSDNDLDMFFTLMQNGITKQIVTSLKENMLLDMSSVNVSKQSEIVNSVKNEYARIDEEISSSFLKSNIEQAKEIGNVVLDGVQTGNPVLQEIISNAKTEFNNIFEHVGQSLSWDDYIDSVDAAMDEAIKQSSAVSALPKVSKSKIVQMMGDVSRNMTDPLLDMMRDKAQGEYQKVLLDIFSNPEFLNDGVKSAIKVQNIGDLIDFNSIKEVGRQVSQAVGEGLADGIDAHSDSRRSDKAGENFVNGLTHSIEEHTPEALAAAEHLREAVSEALNESLESGKNGEVIPDVNDKNSISLGTQENISNVDKLGQELQETGQQGETAAEQIKVGYQEVFEVLSQIIDLTDRLHNSPKYLIDLEGNGEFLSFAKKYMAMPRQEFDEDQMISNIKSAYGIYTKAQTKLKNGEVDQSYVDNAYTTFVKVVVDNFLHSIRSANFEPRYIRMVLSEALPKKMGDFIEDYISQFSSFDSRNNAYHKELYAKYGSDPYETLKGLKQKLASFGTGRNQEVISDDIFADYTIDDAQRILDIFEKSKISADNFKSILRDVCNVLGIEIPQAAQSSQESISHITNETSLSSTTQEDISNADKLGQELQETGQQGQTAGEHIAEGMREAKKEAESTLSVIDDLNSFLATLENRNYGKGKGVKQTQQDEYNRTKYKISDHIKTWDDKEPVVFMGGFGVGAKDPDKYIHTIAKLNDYQKLVRSDAKNIATDLDLGVITEEQAKKELLVLKSIDETIQRRRELLNEYKSITNEPQVSTGTFEEGIQNYISELETVRNQAGEVDTALEKALNISSAQDAGGALDVLQQLHQEMANTSPAVDTSFGREQFLTSSAEEVQAQAKAMQEAQDQAWAEARALEEVVNVQNLLTQQTKPATEALREQEQVSTGTTESAEGAQEEASKLDNVANSAGKAAEAKKGFAEANREVLASIVESLKGLDSEGNAFNNLNKLIKTLSADPEKGINNLVQNLESIKGALNSDVSDSGLIAALKELSSRDLSDLATALSNAKRANDIKAATQPKESSDDGKKPNTSEINQLYNGITKNLDQIKKLEIENIGLNKKDAETLARKKNNIAEIKRLGEQNISRAQELAKLGGDQTFQEERLLEKTQEVTSAIERARTENEARLKDQASVRSYDEEIAKLEEIRKLKVENAKNPNNESAVASNLEKIKQLETDIKNIQADRVSLYGYTEAGAKRVAEAEQKTADAVKAAEQARETKIRDSVGGKTDTWLTNMTNLLEGGKYVESFEGDVRKVITSIEALRENAKNLGADDIERQMQEIESSVKDINFGKGLEQFKKATSLTIDKLKQQISDFKMKNSAMGGDFQRQFEAIQLKFNSAGSLAEVKAIYDEFLRLKNVVTEAGKTGKSFFDTFKERLTGVNAQLIAQWLSWQDMIRYARAAFDAVRELDDGLIDLKKTTQMTTSELNEFYLDASNTAKQLGVTTKEIISQAAAWSRLGYSSKEAATEMASLSSIFSSISPGMSTDVAQQGLVSIMRAYNIGVSDVEREIMDNINTLGRFAQTYGDIGNCFNNSADNYIG